MKDPDGICLDRDQAVWVASFSEDAFIRIDREGRERQRIEVPGRRAIACVLGGSERRTLFCLSAASSHEEMMQRKSSARIDVVDVEDPARVTPEAGAHLRNTAIDGGDAELCHSECMAMGVVILCCAFSMFAAIPFGG